MSNTRTISASWVAPVSSPPIADGVISYVEDEITYVGPNDGRVVDERFDNSILLPGLVNAHTHLDLTGAATKTPPILPFSKWLQSVIDFRRLQRDVVNDVAIGAEQCLKSGTTLVGDIAGAGHPLRLPGGLSLRAVTFYELLGLTNARCETALSAWRSTEHVPASPHAPYSIHKNGIAAAANEKPLVAIHVAESRDEEELLRSRSGPLVSFLESLGVWEPDGLVSSWDELFQLIANSPSPLIIHGNYLAPVAPIPKHATVVYCPRTHAAFGHPPHPFRHFLNRRIRVVLGTDSLASNPDLSVLNEARFVFRKYPDFDPSTLLHMITDWPAIALRFGDRCGTLESGKFADLCVVDLPTTTDPLVTLFQEATPIRAVYVGGVRVV